MVRVYLNRIFEKFLIRQSEIMIILNDVTGRKLKKITEYLLAHSWNVWC